MNLTGLKAKKHLDSMKMPAPAEESAEADVTDSSVTAKKKKKKKSAAGGEQWLPAQDSVMTTGSN